MGHLFKLVLLEWETEQDAICKGKQGSHMQEQQCHQLILVHGLHVPEQRVEMSHITQPTGLEGKQCLDPAPSAVMSE